MTNKLLIPAVRQYCHNDGKGLLIGYDKETTDKIVEDLEIENNHTKWLLAKAWGAIQEAGYEDHDFKLRDKIEDALESKN